MRMRALMFAVVMTGLVLMAGAAKAITLPACNPGVTCLQFGDFNVFSLPLLNLQATGSSVPGPGDPFFVSSTFGQIKNDTIIGINNGNCTSTGNPTGIDCAENTPSANNANNVTFSTDTAADPGGLNQFAGDQQSWDATISTLLGINPTPLVAYFAFNETGSGTGLLTTDLLVWASVSVCSAGDVTCQTFFLGGNTKPDVNNLPPADGSQGFGPWVYVHAGICADAAGNFLGFPDVNGNCTQAGAVLRNQNNLGQNAAAFAINSPGLDAALHNPANTIMHVTWLMGYINGGGETAFILPTTVEQPPGAPEPGTLVLLGIGLLALGYVARRARA